MTSKLKRYYERTADIFRKIRFLFLSSKEIEKSKGTIRKNVFVNVEKEKRWGDSHASGWGSTIEYTIVTQSIVNTVIEQYNIKSMFDASCGDFAWMPLVIQKQSAEFKYIGSDIVPELINRHKIKYPQYEFRNLDFVTDELPKCDLIFSRDALQHLPIGDIKKALLNFSKSDAKYLLASTHLRRFGWRNSRECRVGQCRDRNLLLKPFNLPDPILVFSEQDESHKFLGLWKLPFENKN